MTTTYPRIDHHRGLVAQVVRYPGRKVCARIAWRTLAGAPLPPATERPLREFLLDEHRTACLTVCLNALRDYAPRRDPRALHTAMVTARRILEGGGTIRCALHHALQHFDTESSNAPRRA